MEDNKIYVKKVENVKNNLKLTLSIYDSKLPEFTIGSIMIPVKIDELTGSVISLEKVEEFQIPRPESNKIISVPFNYPIGHIEDLIKKEKDFFDNNKKEVEEKLNYFKGKIY